MIKFRLHFDKDKETEWINQMAAEGYAMTGFCLGFYQFEECEPGEYIYQIDITESMFQVHRNYREFMNEAGVEIVCLWGFWVILRRRASEGPFELYTDVESTIEHYTKIRNMFKRMGIIEAVCLLMEIVSGLHGYRPAWAFFWLLTAFLLTIVKEIAHIDEILYELKSRLGEVAEKGTKGGQISGLLAAGMLVNFCALSIDNPEYEVVQIFLTVLSCVMMLAGIYFTVKKRN